MKINTFVRRVDAPPTVKVLQKEGEEIPRGILAESIVGISKAFDQLLHSGLNKHAVIALIRDKTGFGKGVIETVLNALSQLREDYCE